MPERGERRKEGAGSTTEQEDPARHQVTGSTGAATSVRAVTYRMVNGV